VEVGCFGVVADGEEGALGDCFFGHELAGVEFVVRPIVEGDAEVFGGGDSEGEGAAGAELVLAGGYGGHGFGPGGVGHLVATVSDLRSCTLNAAKALLVASTVPGNPTARVRSSMTMDSKPSLAAAMAEKPTQKS